MAFFARNGKLHKPFPFRGRRSAKQRRFYTSTFSCARYCSASSTQSSSSSCLPARSATVRATRRMRSWARAERPKASSGGAQQPLGGGGHAADAPHLPGGELGVAEHTLKTRGGIALCLNGPGGKQTCLRRSALLSEGTTACSSSKAMGSISTHRSMRSSSGPGTPAAVLPHRHWVSRCTAGWGGRSSRTYRGSWRLPAGSGWDRWHCLPRGSR